MIMYPAYKRSDVMSEYAITFFTLLNEGYRSRSRHYFKLAQITLITIMNDEQRSQFLKQLEMSTKDPSDILGLSDSASSMDEVKDFLRKI